MYNTFSPVEFTTHTVKKGNLIVDALYCCVIGLFETARWQENSLGQIEEDVIEGIILSFSGVGRGVENCGRVFRYIKSGFFCKHPHL